VEAAGGREWACHVHISRWCGLPKVALPSRVRNPRRDALPSGKRGAMEHLVLDSNAGKEEKKLHVAYLLIFKDLGPNLYLVDRVVRCLASMKFPTIKQAIHIPKSMPGYHARFVVCSPIRRRCPTIDRWRCISSSFILPPLPQYPPRLIVKYVSPWVSP
jgi:hypothetical protein